MADLSNKSLALVLLGTMVISLMGTFIVLNRVNENGITGYATSGTGIVNLSVDTTMSITTNESSLVNFGGCQLNGTRAINLTSYDGEDAPAYCTVGGNLPNNLSVRNDGNVIVNVSIATSACAPGAGNTSCTFLNNSALTNINDNGLFQYNVTNAGRYGYTGGCGTVNYTTATGWTTFNGTNSVHACTNLASAVTANSIVVNFRARVPPGLNTGVQTTTITFTATRP